MTGTPIRIGVLGIGSMGRHHVRNARHTEGFELVAVADPAGDPYDVAGNLAPVLPGVEALIDAGIDAAIVAVPTAFHEEAALALADAGIHALVEKPLAGDVETGERIASAFEDRGLVGAVGYVERCNPALLSMKQRIADGQLGQVFQIATRRQSPFPARISDVGVVKDLATHDVDLTSWIVDSPYKEVFGQTAFRSGRETEDLLVASGSLENGILVNHLVNWMSPFKDRTTIVTGENGALVADTAMGDLTYFANGTERIGWDQITPFRGVSEGEVIRYALKKREPLAVEQANFRDAILGVGDEHVSMREGVQTLRVVEALLESANANQVVEL